MKNILTKSITAIFVISLILSFAACGKDKEETTTGVPTTAKQSTTVPTTAPAETPLSVEIIRVALNSAGSSNWDGSYTSLTAEQKQNITKYFTKAGRTLEFRSDNVYFVESSSVTTEPVTEQTTTSAVSTTKASITTTAAAVVKSITLDNTILNLTVGSSGLLTATVKPDNAKDKTVSWKSDNEAVAKVDSAGNVTGLAEGSTIITCTANGGKNVSTTCGVTVSKLGSSAILSYSFDPDGNFFYVEDNPWQRTFGFNEFYDWGAPITQIFYDTVRVKFTYNGIDWLIQLWKGQYGYAFVGSEIGVYTKPTTRTINHYDCASDENSLKMEMSLYRKDKWLFTRTYRTYWWSTGFVTGALDNFDDTAELAVNARITFKDADMTAAFVKAFEGCGFVNGGYSGYSTPETFAVSGNDVSFCWKNIKQ